MPISTTKRFADTIATCALALSAASPAQALVTELDRFTIVKNGSVLFQDTFDDGVPPPVAPGEFTTYLFQRGTFVETGGKLIMDTATAPATRNALGTEVVTTRSTFSTNIVGSDGVNGLKSNHTFSVTAIFSLVAGTAVGDSYGIRLADRNEFGNAEVPGSSFGNDFLELRLLHTNADTRVVQFRRQDFANDTITQLMSFPLAESIFAANDQVELTLAKSDVVHNVITASFAFIAGGTRGLTHTFLPTAEIFHGENWTRAEFLASAAPIPEPDTYAMLLAGIGLIGWQLRRKAKQAGVRRVA